MLYYTKLNYTIISLPKADMEIALKQAGEQRKAENQAFIILYYSIVQYIKYIILHYISLYHILHYTIVYQ